MSLRDDPAERAATLPDGRLVVVRVGVPEDGSLEPTAAAIDPPAERSGG